MQSHCDSGCVDLKKMKSCVAYLWLTQSSPSNVQMACLNLKWNHVPAKPRKLFAFLWFQSCQIFSNVRNPDTPTITSHNWLSRIKRTSICTQFFIFWVISNFFKCQKSHYSCHGLLVNSHANVTYSFPTLKIILIPTMTRSNCFWFISLFARTAPPMSETQLSYVT